MLSIRKLFKKHYNESMKNKLPTILLSLSLLSLVSFDVGQEVELDAFLNARTNPNFLKYSKNIKTTLAKGTTGEVLDVKNFSSGNAGIKMKVTNGPKTGQSYWVYYNSKAPAIKLKDKKAKEDKEISVKDITHEELKPIAAATEIPPDQSPGVPMANVEAITLQPVSATRDLDEHAVAATVGEVSQVKEEVNTVLNESVDRSRDCGSAEAVVLEDKEPTVSSTTEAITEETFTESMKGVNPFREVPGKRVPVYFTSRGANEPYSFGKTRNGKVEAFKLQNDGIGNNIIAKKGDAIDRTFEFEFPDRARSDMKLMITDSPDDRTSHTSYRIMLFFPRLVLPSVEKIDNELVVTLPNKEVVKYNTSTKQIIDGVLKEGQMVQNGHPSPVNVSYTGSGVSITANKAGDLPYGDIELKNGDAAPSVSTATVSKKGHKDCQIPSKEIWYNDKDKDTVLIKPEFQTDAGLDTFIQKKCGFSIF
jgi:hypothetical protein